MSKANLHAVPADYQRKQTIAGGERFTTPALKEYEEKVLGADERILERELEIFGDLRQRVAAEAVRIQDTARALATLDVLAGLAETAAVANFTKPHVHDGDDFVVTDGRHPVVERFASRSFVPNDIELDGTTRQLVIVTGPNMGGKSTYLRQSRAASQCWRRSARSCRRGTPSCRSWTGSSRASARRTTSRAGSPPSWWRCRRPPTSCTPPPPAAWSCSTRSGAARPPSTG